MPYHLEVKRGQKRRCKAAVITKQLVAGIPVVDVSAPDMVTAQDAVKRFARIILIITCVIYTYSLLHGIKGISHLANACMYLLFGFLIYVLVFGGESKYILETGLESLGRMINHFVDLATFTDSLRTSHFPQNWTIYYWAYWMVWSIAAPFFIGQISKGRTIRQTILDGYVFGVGSTCVSFIILGNYSMGKQMSGVVDFVSQYQAGANTYDLIIGMIKTMPLVSVVLIWLICTMIAFYATSFDSIALIGSCCGYKKLEEGQQPPKKIEFMWCALLIILPIALLFSDSSMSNIQSVSIIAAFPIGIVMILIVLSLLKELKSFWKTTNKTA